MSETLSKISERLSEFKDQLSKAKLSTKKIPDISDSADINDNNKMIEEKHMNGKNVEQYNHEGEKIIHERAKDVCNLGKTTMNSNLDTPPTPGASVMQSEQSLGDEERKAMEGKQKLAPTLPEPTSMETPDGAKGKRKPVTHDECGRPFAKDELDEKIKAKIKAKMDEKNFGEADATRHIIDRDRGEKITPKSKKEPLLQTELIKYDAQGQWSLKDDV